MFYEVCIGTGCRNGKDYWSFASSTNRRITAHSIWFEMITSCLGSVWTFTYRRKTLPIVKFCYECLESPIDTVSDLDSSLICDTKFLIRIFQTTVQVWSWPFPISTSCTKKTAKPKKSLKNETWKLHCFEKNHPFWISFHPHPHPHRATEVSNVPTSSVMYRWSDGIRPISGSFLSRLWTSLLWMAACLWSVAPW